MKDTSMSSRQCPFCTQFTEGSDFHEEFDFYKHPAAKAVIRQLRDKVNKVLPEGKRDVEEYAVWRKLRSERGVVMPAYGRLLNCWKWMLLLEDQDRKIDESRPEPPMESANLPF